VRLVLDVTPNNESIKKRTNEMQVVLPVYAAFQAERRRLGGIW
jgi:hypothetical protein